MDKIDELLQFVNECIEANDWDQLATAFILPGELEPVEIVIRTVAELDLENRINEFKLRDRLLAEPLYKWFKVIRVWPKGDWAALAEQMRYVMAPVRNLLLRSPANRGPWFFPALRRVVTTFVSVCEKADQLDPTVEKRAAAAQEMRSLQNVLSNGANAHERHKASILLLAGLSIKLNLQLNVSANISSMIKQLAPLLNQHFEQCPLPERLRYCYWSGKWHLAEQRVGAAYPMLRDAFSQCPNSHFRNKRRIFIQLCAAAIPLGIFPSQDLLDLFQVDQYFTPIILAMKAGDAVALNLALNSPLVMTWFLKQWVHAVLKEKCVILLWRNLVRRTVHEVQTILEDPTVIPCDWLSIAFGLSYDVDEGWETQGVQGVLMSLIVQGYIKGTILQGDLLSLASDDLSVAFPTPSQIRQTTKSLTEDYALPAHTILHLPQ